MSPKKVKESAGERMHLENEREIALDFASAVHIKFDKMVKASVLFGSQAKNTATDKSDIDMIFIIDDAAINWDMELIAWYREELGKLIAEKNYNKELHINTVKMTTWWQDLLRGDPVVINIIRYGDVLIDSGGVFTPLKALLQQGKIKSTVESVYAALSRAPTHLVRSKASKMAAIEGVYWCMVDAAQAALITVGKLPPSPEHIPMMLKETFVDQGMLNMKAVTAMRDLYVLHKGIAHAEITEIKGKDIDVWQETADKFLSDMTDIIDKILEQNKK
ncbi:hypothetical protein EXS73_02285 [Candidatus Pacearchaeota archaeon]|nr:hypothetical protein [Candidatus Pacearchaeota archaeon]